MQKFEPTESRKVNGKRRFGEEINNTAMHLVRSVDCSLQLDARDCRLWVLQCESAARVSIRSHQVASRLGLKDQGRRFLAAAAAAAPFGSALALARATRFRRLRSALMRTEVGS